MEASPTEKGQHDVLSFFGGSYLCLGLKSSI